MKSREIKRKGWIAVLAVLALGAIAPSSALAASDLSITKTDSADPASKNSEFTYTLAVTNAGPDPANAVQVVDQLPGQLDFVAGTTSQGTCEEQGKKVTCELGTLASGASATVSIRVKPNKTGEVSNKATVTTADTDTNMANNSDTETTRIVRGYAPPRTCAGQVATIVGTPGADTLEGTTGRDVIVGRGGNDTIEGITEDDVVCGSRGNDAIKGHGGEDLLRGGAGEDTIRGGGGDDILRGGGGNDILRGGTGDDLLRGGGGDDLLKGIGGTDTLRGGSGKDTLRGGGADDICRGGGGNDSKRAC